MKITQELLDDLTAKAKASPRLRMNGSSAFVGDGCLPSGAAG